MASNILGKISKERTISAVVIVIAALAAILPGGSFWRQCCMAYRSSVIWS